MKRPDEGAILYGRASDQLRGSYVASRDCVRISTDTGHMEVPFVEGHWDFTRDRKLTEMQVAELAWSALAAYRRMLGRPQPEWSMLRDSQRIDFSKNGDVMTAAEEKLVVAIVEGLGE